MTQRAGVVRGVVSSEHIVQIFDTTESLADTVSAFLHDGYRRGDHVLVVAKPKNWAAVSDRLEERACPVAAAIAAGRLVVLDAATTLAKFMRHGLPDAHLFSSVIGDLVHRLNAETGAGLTIYLEVVELLAEEGNFRGAQRIETLWNELGERCSFRLLCGYSAAHFVSPGADAALREICDSHSRVQANAADPLATWLLAARGGLRSMTRS